MSRQTKSANPMYPDAHPTAPGGMKEVALVTELVTKHGWDAAAAKALKWPEKIDAVIEERRLREAEAKAEAAAAEGEDAYELLPEDAEVVAFDSETVTVVMDQAGRDPEGDGDEDDDVEDDVEDDDDEDWCDKHETYNCADCSGVTAAFEESLAEPNPFDAQPPISDDLPDTDDPEVLMAVLRSAREAEEAAQPAAPSLLVKDPAGIGSLDYIFDGHMGAGPSASERWLHCTASLGASRAFLETLTKNQQEQFSIANLAARQGTTAHAAAEVEARVVLGEVDQSEADMTLLELSIEPDTGAEAYDDEMAEYITEYVDLVRTYAQDRSDQHVLIEQTVEAVVPLTDLHEGEVYSIRGSGDCIVLPTEDDPTLVVADLKYGNGIDVDVDENPQVRIYALGALGLLVNDDGELITDVETVTYHIVQPRLGGIKTWSEPLADLLQWRDEVLAPGLTAALFGTNEGATFAPSENACQFCPARGSCAALAETRLTMAADLFDVIVESEFVDGPGAFPETATLTDSRLGELLTQIKGLTSIYEDLKDEAQRRLFRGTHVPGWQLVNYSPRRQWKDDAAERLPAEDNPDLYSEPVLVSPTQAEKILGKQVYQQIAELVVVPDKVPVIAPEGDRRKPWTGKPPEQMFDVEETDTDSDEEAAS